jgi:hypothetical protein
MATEWREAPGLVIEMATAIEAVSPGIFTFKEE